mmetsp:Transcript_41713/g.104217  ORF Transcript_41713/g.104217 Transcript_41713/m.104217 type:complete len:195 (+) Transcript_41713:353-937(+)
MLLANARMLFARDEMYERPVLSPSEVDVMKSRWQGRQLKWVGHAVGVFGARESQADFFAVMAKRPHPPHDSSRDPARSNRIDAGRILQARIGVKAKGALAPGPQPQSLGAMPSSPLAGLPQGLQSVELPLQVAKRVEGALSKAKKIGRRIKRMFSVQPAASTGNRGTGSGDFDPTFLGALDPWGKGVGTQSLDV